MVLVFDGWWYSMVFIGIPWNSMVFKGIQWSLSVSVDLDYHRMWAGYRAHYGANNLKPNILSFIWKRWRGQLLWPRVSVGFWHLLLHAGSSSLFLPSSVWCQLLFWRLLQKMRRRFLNQLIAVLTLGLLFLSFYRHSVNPSFEDPSVKPLTIPTLPYPCPACDYPPW